MRRRLLPYRWLLAVGILFANLFFFTEIANASSAEASVFGVMPGDYYPAQIATSLSAVRDLIVFGDSLSDQGNARPFLERYNEQVYREGRFTNGETAVEIMAQAMGWSVQPSGHLVALREGRPLVNADFGNNYAVATALAAGDRVYDVPLQVLTYLRASQGVADPNTLYVFLAGSNDVMDIAIDLPWPKTVERVMLSAGRVYQQMEVLLAAGARHFLVIDVPDVSRTPALKSLPAVARWQISWINRLFNEQLEQWRPRFQLDFPQAHVTFFGAYTWMAHLVENPTLYGLADVMNACYFYGASDWNPPCSLATVDTFVFLDSIHPTAAVHRRFGQALAATLQQAYVLE